MAIGAPPVVDGHRVRCWMADRDTGRIVFQDKRREVVDGVMCQRPSLVDVTVEAVDGAGIALYDVLHRRSHRSLGVDIPRRVMTGGTDSHMTGEDIRPVLDGMTVGTGL